MPEALILGGTGQIGRAVADWLTPLGWRVRLASRSAPPPDLAAAHIRIPTDDPSALSRAACGVDLLLDCACFDAGDADRLLPVSADVGRIVAISSVSVYCDVAGRTLDEAHRNGFPRFDGPVGEDTATVAPGSETYSTRKMAMETRLRESARCPVTILRPAAIHGPFSRHAREWWFVKRLLDGRAVIPLCHGGASRFHTTSTEAIARAVVLAAAPATAAVVNVVDGDAPEVAEIGRIAMQVLGLSAEILPLPGPPLGTVGKTPWSGERPLVYASTLPPMPRYAETAPAAVRWLAQAIPPEDWQRHIPILFAYPRDHFDYAAEDRALSEMRR